MSAGTWTPVCCLWRPKLPDPADDHLAEPAVAVGARTGGVFRSGGMRGAWI